MADFQNTTTLPALTVELLSDRWLKGMSVWKIAEARGMDWRDVWQTIVDVPPKQIKAAIGDCRNFRR
jgi:hypothetical protein